MKIDIVAEGRGSDQFCGIDLFVQVHAGSGLCFLQIVGAYGKDDRIRLSVFVTYKDGILPVDVSGSLPAAGIFVKYVGGAGQILSRYRVPFLVLSSFSKIHDAGQTFHPDHRLASSVRSPVPEIGYISFAGIHQGRVSGILQPFLYV